MDPAPAQRQQRTEPAPMAVCIDCGGPCVGRAYPEISRRCLPCFKAKAKADAKRTSARWYAKVRKPTAPCIRCGGALEAGRQRGACAPCQTALKRESQERRSARMKKPSKSCEVCGDAVLGKRLHWCSLECREVAKKRLRLLRGTPVLSPASREELLRRRRRRAQAAQVALEVLESMGFTVDRLLEDSL